MLPRRDHHLRAQVSRWCRLLSSAWFCSRWKWLGLWKMWSACVLSSPSENSAAIWPRRRVSASLDDTLEQTVLCFWSRLSRRCQRTFALSGSADIWEVNCWNRRTRCAWNRSEEAHVVNPELLNKCTEHFSPSCSSLFDIFTRLYMCWIVWLNACLHAVFACTGLWHMEWWLFPLLV